MKHLLIGLNWNDLGLIFNDDLIFDLCYWWSNIWPLLLIGKEFKAKEETKKEMTEEQQKDESEWDDLLKEASEEELVDLAGNYLPLSVA